jgi:pilus assembly protein Flp/PilA
MFGWISYARLYVRTAIKSDRGATMVEYALMVALIAIVAIVAVGLVGTNVTGIFQRTADTLGPLAP